MAYREVWKIGDKIATAGRWGPREGVIKKLPRDGHGRYVTMWPDETQGYNYADNPFFGPGVPYMEDDIERI